MDFLCRTITTSAPASVILIRLIIGGVFFVEGVQKFLYPAEVGAGRFAKIGISSPDVMGPFVGRVRARQPEIRPRPRELAHLFH